DTVTPDHLEGNVRLRFRGQVEDDGSGLISRKTADERAGWSDFKPGSLRDHLGAGGGVRAGVPHPDADIGRSPFGEGIRFPDDRRAERSILDLDRNRVAEV